MAEPKLEIFLVWLLLHHLLKKKWQHEHQYFLWRKHQDNQWRDHKWWTEWWLQTFSMQSHRGFVSQISRTDIRECRARDGLCEDRTFRRTHIFLSVSRTFGHHMHMRVAHDFTGQMFGTRCTSAHLKSHPLTTCVFDHSLTCLTHFHRFVPRHFHTDSTAYDWNQEISLRHSARRIVVWTSGWIRSSHRLWAQGLHQRQQCAHDDQVHFEERQFQLRDLPYHHSRGFREFRQFSAASGSQRLSAASIIKWAPTCGPALGKWCEVVVQFQVLKGICREEKDIEIWNCAELCSKE